MNIKVLPKLHRGYKLYKAASLDDAYKKGFFCNSMRRDELLERATKHNNNLKCHAHEHYRGLFMRSIFICGITHNMTIPKYTIMKYDTRFDKELPRLQLDGSIKNEYIATDPEEGKILARGWLPTLHILERRGYQIDWEGLRQ